MMKRRQAGSRNHTRRGRSLAGRRDSPRSDGARRFLWRSLPMRRESNRDTCSAGRRANTCPCVARAACGRGSLLLPPDAPFLAARRRSRRHEWRCLSPLPAGAKRLRGRCRGARRRSGPSGGRHRRARRRRRRGNMILPRPAWCFFRLLRGRRGWRGREFRLGVRQTFPSALAACLVRIRRKSLCRRCFRRNFAGSRRRRRRSRL